ncbi:MAG: GNAT family N-acetyltransferase [Deltaproteobacteria bacterium]|nr:GNAT family N-acetyltransferase [Deltaproteobacteria bacterium]
MMATNYWADSYIDKKCDATTAMQHIRPGLRVFIGSSSGEPQHLIMALAEAAKRYTDIEIVGLMALESTPLTLMAEKSGSQNLSIRSFYLGSAKTKQLAANRRFITPINLSAVPRLFRSRLLPIHVALIQVTPPDDFGWMSLGVSVDITMAAALSADVVIAQVNTHMPRVLGQSFVHVNDVDHIVEHDEPLLTIGQMPESESADNIGRLISRLIDDGSTLQLGPGITQRATLLALSEKNDLGVHSQYLSDDFMHLVSRGVITNRKKGFNEGKIVASTALGSEYLYEFINDNPAIEFHPSNYVNNPNIISRHHKMVSINVAMAMDLTGQVAVDALPHNNFSGVSGTVDFIRGSTQAPGGKSFLLLTATSDQGQKSRIVPTLKDTTVVVPRGDVQYVATEYGVVNLFGKSLQERATAMISIAHPQFRDELFHQAKELGLIAKERDLKESIYGVYPRELEETVELDGISVTIRPAKPVDVRRIQEHFYNLEKRDVIARFFHEKTTFIRDEVADVSQVDYKKDLTIVAIIGEFGFGEVVGVGESLLDPSNNMAEVAFSVSQKYKKKGLGKLLLSKLCQTAQMNAIAGLFAYTSPDNRGMINLFMTLPFNVTKKFEDDLVLLRCDFRDKKET